MSTAQQIWDDLCESENGNPHWKQIRFEEIEALVKGAREAERDWYDCEKELTEVSVAIGSVRWMDPPDGGSVGLGEQVARMRADLECAETALLEVIEFARATRLDPQANVPAILAIAERALGMVDTPAN